MNESVVTPELGWVALYVSDVGRSVDFYQSAFGLTTAMAHPAGDYAEFATGTTALSLLSIELASTANGADMSTRSSPTGSITLVVTDVDAAFATACMHGAQPRVEPLDKPWGQRCGVVADLDGNLVELATRVA